MPLADAFALTPAERARLEAAPFRGTDDIGWMAFALAVQKQILKAYTEGEIDEKRALAVTLSCSIGCEPGTRAVLMATTSLHLARTTPRARTVRRQANPQWVRNSAATLVQMLHEARPAEPLAPNEANEYSTPITEEAIHWLVTLGLCDRIDTRTLYRWYRAAKKDEVHSSPALTA